MSKWGDKTFGGRGGGIYHGWCHDLILVPFHTGLNLTLQNKIFFKKIHNSIFGRSGLKTSKRDFFQKTTALSLFK